MLTERAKADALIVAGVFGVVLAVLLIWPDRRATNQYLVYIVGVGLFCVIGFLFDWFVVRRRPSFDLIGFITMTGPKRKKPPLRYSLPTVAGIVGTGAIVNWLSNTNVPDWGIDAYVLTVPLVLAGVAASSIWLAHAAGGAGTDVPAN